MADNSSRITNMELHPPAEQQIEQFVDDFTTAILYQSKVIAFQRQADLVITRHVEEAYEIIRRQGVQRNRSREFRTFIGSALFGAFVPGFIGSLLESNIILLILFVGLGFVGLTMFLWEWRQP